MAVTPKPPDKDLLSQEYFHLQSLVEVFDGKSLTIKAWSVSLAGAIAGAGAFADEAVLLLFAALASLMFWAVDCAWKVFQYAHYQRLATIEAYMRGDLDHITNLQIARSWSESFYAGGWRRFQRMLFWGHVFLPHGAMFVGLLSAFLLLSLA